MKMKKYVAILTAFLIFILPFFSTYDSEYSYKIVAVAIETYSLGDVNGDKLVDGKDASKVLGEYSSISAGGTSTLTSVEASSADVDNDGIITAKDASHILRYYAFCSTGGREDIKTFLNEKSDPETNTDVPPTSTSQKQTVTVTTTTGTSNEQTLVVTTEPSTIWDHSSELSVPSVTIQITSESSLDLSWEKVDDATNYSIEFSKQSDFSFINLAISTSRIQYNCSSLTPGETYYIRICAQKKIDEEIYSSDYYVQKVTLSLEFENITSTTIPVTTTSNTTSTTTTTTVTTKKETTTSSVTSIVVTTAAPVTSTTPITVVRKVSWTDPNTGKNVGYTLTFNKSVSDYYSSIPRIKEINKWTEYCSDNVNKSLLKEFADWVKVTGDKLGYTEYQRVLLAAQVAQQIPYKTDIESRGMNEYPKYPYETFFDGCGDCEDKSIILAGILHEMNYQVVLLHFSDHMAVGIAGGSSIYGQYYTLSGSNTRYFYIESTYFGAKIGECPVQYKNEIPKVYVLRF